MFFTQMYPSRAIGVMIAPPNSKLRPTPIDADHWSPLGLAVAEVLIAGTARLLDGMKMLRVES